MAANLGGLVRGSAAALLALTLAAPWTGALAQATSGGTRTGKERMIEKARDPQRVDDCKVPVAKRDPARPRADCTSPATATASAGGQPAR